MTDPQPLADPLAPVKAPVPDAPPIVVSTSMSRETLFLLVRYGVTLLAGLGLLSKFLTPAQIAYMKSDEFLGVAAALAAVAMPAWAWIAARVKKRLAVHLANHVDDSIAVVKT